jgi:hypothetical protein
MVVGGFRGSKTCVSFFLMFFIVCYKRLGFSDLLSVILCNTEEMADL